MSVLISAIRSRVLFWAGVSRQRKKLVPEAFYKMFRVLFCICNAMKHLQTVFYARKLASMF